MARPYHHGALAETLIALALEEIERESGPDGLSVAVLARRAGVSPMAPYRHFPDRHALLEALARRGFEDLGERMRAADDPDPAAALEAFGVCYVEFAAERPGLFRLMYGGTPPTSGEELAENPMTVLGLVTRRVAELVGPDQRDDVLLAAWSLVHGLASLCAAGRIRHPAASPADLARRVARVLRRAIAPP